MRGKDAIQQGDDLLIRITPAHAGKSMAADPEASREAGSPPRMRGKVGPNGGAYGHTGITPAHAGKSFWAVQEKRREQGSPPRMRGKVLSAIGT